MTDLAGGDEDQEGAPPSHRSTEALVLTLGLAGVATLPVCAAIVFFWLGRLELPACILLWDAALAVTLPLATAWWPVRASRAVGAPVLAVAATSGAIFGGALLYFRVTCTSCGPHCCEGAGIFAGLFPFAALGFCVAAGVVGGIVRGVAGLAGKRR